MNNVILQTDLTYQPTVNPMAQMGTGFWVAYFIFIVLMVISMWKVYEKAGQPGWAAIIPVYNLIALLKIIKRPSKWIWYYAGAIVVYMVGAAMMMSSPVLGGLLLAVGSIALLALSIMDYHRLSLSFGKGAGWTVGLLLLSFIFIPIMAFRKNIQYIWGERGTDDHLVTEE
jgi:hypothetical protein